MQIRKEKPTREEAEKAVKTLLLWLGENPEREGLKDTPKRVVKAYEELFQGYKLQPKDALNTFFHDVDGYDDPILIKDVPFFSYCEHHMLPIKGRVHIAYVPNKKIIGLSKIPRLIDVFSKRLQTQEALTAQIANSLIEHLEPRGVALYIEAEHMCMAMRGVKKEGAYTITTKFHGIYKDNEKLREQFLHCIKI